MVAKWANPSCDTSLLYLRAGEIFRIEPPLASPPSGVVFFADAIANEANVFRIVLAMPTMRQEHDDHL